MEEQETKPTWLQGLEDAFAGHQLILDAVEEEWWVCPFHRPHKVPASGMQRHIGTCGEKKVVQKYHLEKCTADVTHVVPCGSLADHLQRCKAKATRDREARECGETVPPITTSQRGDPWSRSNNVPPATFHTKCRSCDECISFVAGQCAVCFLLQPQALTARTRNLSTALGSPSAAVDIMGTREVPSEMVECKEHHTTHQQLSLDAPVEHQVPGPTKKRRRGDHHDGSQPHTQPSETGGGASWQELDSDYSHRGLDRHVRSSTAAPSAPVPSATPPQAPPEPLLTSASVLPSFVRVSADTAPTTADQPVSPITPAPNEEKFWWE